MIVKVKKVKKNSWNGIYNYKNNHYVKIGVGKKQSTGELNIPFNDAELKEWEIKLGYSPGYLAKHTDFWKNYYIALGAETRFDTNLAKHQFDLELLKASRFIAKTMDEVNKSNDVLFVIYNEEEVAKVGNKGRKIKAEAYELFNALSTEDMKKALILFGHKPYELSNEVVEDTLGALLESDPKRFIDIVGDRDIELKSDILTAVHEGIMEFRGMTYSYGTSNFGELDDTVKALKSPEYKETLVVILKQVKEKQNRRI